MTSASRRKPKFFTVEQANATLPLVRAICGDVAALASDMIERKQRLDHLLEGRDRDVEQGDPYGDELYEMERELERDSRRLHEYAGELADLGVELKSAPEGLIDFPALMDGRPVYLCWKLGEPEVLYWHELDAGFRGRQALTAGSVSGDSGPGDSSAEDADKA